MKSLGRATAIPATAILDRDGRRVFRIIGEVHEDAIRARLDWLLSDRTAAAPPELVIPPGVTPEHFAQHEGTPEGQSFYVTAAKDLRPHTGLPVAPYVGVAYGTYEDKARVIAGANIAFARGLSSLLIFDGVHFHPTLFRRQPTR